MKGWKKKTINSIVALWRVVVSPEMSIEYDFLVYTILLAVKSNFGRFAGAQFKRQDVLNRLLCVVIFSPHWLNTFIVKGLQTMISVLFSSHAHHRDFDVDTGIKAFPIPNVPIDISQCDKDFESCF